MSEVPVQASQDAVQAWPSTLEEFWTWHMEAACRQVDTTLFYSPEGELELCAAYAIATREPYGTWGGLSENDRREHVRRSDPRIDQLRYRNALAAWERRTAGAVGA